MPANLWNQTPCNRLVADRIAHEKHERHLRALENSRGLTNHSTPAEFTHLRTKPKMRKLQEDRAAEIQLENRILLQKMLNIDTKASQFSGEKLCSDRVQPRSLHGGQQQRELDRITSANQEMLKRLQGAKPSLDPRQWDDEEVDRQALKFRLSQNSCRGRAPVHRMPDKPMPSDKLMRLGGMQHFQGNDWAGLTEADLDKKLREVEGGMPPALGM